MPTRKDYNLRPMTRDDLEQVLEWRNSDRIRKAMYTDHVISWDEHLAWFRRVGQQNRSLHFIFEYRGSSIGVVNVTDLDRTNNRCVWGFYIGATDAPKGSGSAMGFVALDHLVEKLGFRKIIGEALADNEDSIRFHKRLGFEEEGRLREHVFKDGRYVDVITLALFDRAWRAIRDELAEKFFRPRQEPCEK
jgi:UDP-4-amino-4,6-dideoxy-N-acetyl-beta-L-altrosamine N-acetyltransferase